MLVNEVSEIKDSGKSGRRVVIIGGGTVGIYAARELARRGQEVLVIEAGGRDLDNFRPESYASVGKAHEGIRLARARNLGGASNLWGGQLVEFQPVDFEGRDWLPDSKWPIDYAEVAAWHQQTYENLGIPAEFLQDQAIFKRTGGVNPNVGDKLELFLTRWLKTPSFAVAFGKEIQSDYKITVLLNHTVVGFAGTGGVITAIEAISRTGQRQMIQGAIFILGAGTIEICRLLLHAAATPGWECPWRDNPHVGRWFQDHLVGRVAAVEVLDRHRFFNIFSTIVCSGHKFQPKLRLTNATLKNTRILNIQGMMSFESSISENLVYLKQFLKAALYSRKISGVGDLFRNLRACGKHLLPLMWKYVIDNRVFVPSSSKISLNIQSEQTPLRGSRLYLDPSVKDKAGLPKVILDWQLGEEELASIREFTLDCDQALRAAGLARLQVDEDLTSLRPQYLNTLRDNYHHTGGARMAAVETDGVVDRNLKVFGTNNLYVAGAATFRTTSNANTTFTALALVTRMADHLANRPEFKR
jgi:choline dehydrogenase-like flavoprotein